jgi:NAD+ synthase (glutamine-hydrolysing)
MKLIRVGATVLNQTPLDWVGNKKRILESITEARRQGVTILCLPELCLTGYGCEDAFHSPATSRTAWTILQEILPETQGLIVSLGLPVMHHNGLYNTACVVVDGVIRGLVAKRFLAGDGIHYEPRWFKPWPQDVQGEWEMDGQRYPIGDLHFNCGGVRIGFEICEDAWVANRPGAGLALKGIDLILNPSASHFAFGKLEVRKRFVLEGSRAFGVSYVYANLLGNEAGRAIYDGGALIASGGKLLAAGPRFAYADSVLTTAVIDVEATRMNQARTASFKPDLAVEARDCVTVPFEFPPIQPSGSSMKPAEWESSLHLKEEEFTRAITLALFDYLRKSHSQGFVVSLSGGADSAAVCCLVALAVRLAWNEIGREGVRNKLGYMASIDEAATSSEIIRRLLTCVYQASVNSSTVTREAARQVAAALDAEFLEFNITSLVESYTAMVAQAINRPLTWKQDDITLQNIQARVRSPGVWMVANIKNALLLATSNRSEAAVGYATMDGDTSGGLSPIAGIDKAFLRQWLQWLERDGPVGLGAMPALSMINVQAPTAELRPQASKQTDEDDLMPYPLLDAIEKAAIRDKLAPVEVWLRMQMEFPQYTKPQLGQWVERFFQLWCRNQWKRERYAPSFHVDDENLDPKTWCRFPILSGGFERELLELRQMVDQP